MISGLSICKYLIFLLASMSVLAPQSEFISREEAMAAAFPGAEIKSERVFLTEQEMKDAAALAGYKIPSALIARYSAILDGAIIGRAYADTHVVRAEKETLLIILDHAGAVKRIEVTASFEPPDHRGTPEWYSQYEGKVLDDDLHLNRSIQPLAGATLTSKAATQAVRRVLAIHMVLSRR